MSEAYASTLNISFDVRGGLLMRQIHHWAADLFMAAILCHMLRIFFTGAYRKPRELNWLIGIVAVHPGHARRACSATRCPTTCCPAPGCGSSRACCWASRSSAPTCRSSCSAGSSPGTDIIPRLYIIHVLLIPGILLALITAHLFLMFHQKHTQMPGKGRTDKNVVGQPHVPVLHGQDRGVLLLHLRRAGPAVHVRPDQPDLAVRPVQPGRRSRRARSPTSTWASSKARCGCSRAGRGTSCGHTFALNVFIPALVPLGLIFTGAALWPFLEQLGHRGPAEHHVNDRPRNAATRTAIGMAVDHLLRRSCGWRARTTSSPTTSTSRCT